MKVELIYDRGCPNVAAARANLLKALAAAGGVPRWTEWDRADPESPPHVRHYGSPTILVDGKDVAGEPAGDGPNCRLYGENGRLGAAPSVAQIAAALGMDVPAASAALGGPGGWQSSLAVVPGLGFALLPKLTCPVCWPAYAGLLSSLGAGFLLDTMYLFPLTLAFLVVALGALAFRAQERRGYGPLATGVVAAMVILAGKFAFESDIALYAGLAVLITASVWNVWPRRGRVIALRPEHSPATTPHRKEIHS